MSTKIPLSLTLLLVLMGVANAALTDGLQAYWSFDDGTGKDSGPYGNTAVNFPAGSSGVKPGPGLIGQAMVFDGTAVIMAQSSPSLNVGQFPDGQNSWSVQFWFKSTNTGRAAMVNKGAAGVNLFPLYVELQGQAVNAFCDGWADHVEGSALCDGNWHHVVAFFDDVANTDGVYIDGVYRGIGGGTHSNISDEANTYPFVIGNQPTTSADPTKPTMNGRPFIGTMDEVALWNRVLSASEAIALYNSGLGMSLASSGKASNPSPADKAVDIPRDVAVSWRAAKTAGTHDVYFGTVLADVNSAGRTKPLSVLVSQGQDANTYDPPGVLVYGQTYYWRIDEVNATPDHKIFTGDVWSFAVEPLGYPMKNITATASSFTGSSDPQKTVDGSGLNANDQHSTDDGTMWLSNGSKPAWIQYAFDDVYKLQEMWVWNSNQTVESFAGFGAKDVTIEYSTDGLTWTTLAGVPPFAKAPGAAGYAHNTTVAFAGAAAKYVKLTINSNWGGLFPQMGLSEVRFYYKPVQAREPQPTAGQTGVAPNVVLGWRAGREASSHKVYFGTDANALALAGAVTQSSFTPAAVNLGTTYYWRVDEVNAAETPSLWTGKVWSFSTQEYTVIDDMESYNDSSNQIFNVWVDGYGTTTNGSQVGYGTSANGTFGETTIIHGGKQSMPLNYNNAGTITYSEAERDWTAAQDWTANGANTLSLWFRGIPVGFQELSSGQILMNGTGTDIYGTADQGRFVYKQLTGNGTIIARVDRLDNTNEWAKAGVMIRETLDAGSSWAYSLASISHGAHFQARLAPGAGATTDTTLTLPAAQTGILVPMWVKLERIGNVFNAYYSADGVTWTPNPWNPQTITMNANVYIGLAVTSHQAGAVTQAEFSSITTTGTITGNWQSVDLGTVAQPAGNTLDTFYVRVVDSTGKSATIKNTDDLAVTAGTWQQWKIPFSSLTGVSAGKVKSLIIGVGDRTSPKHGKGLIYIDDIAVGHPAQ